jgi:hypothetical protein
LLSVNDAADPLRPEEASLTEGPPVDLRGTQVCCANFCRVTGSPEDFILDFAMDCEPGPQQTRRLMATHRITLSPSTAKRLIAALDSLLAQYEGRFGPIEINVGHRLLEAQLPNFLPRD